MNLTLDPKGPKTHTEASFPDLSRFHVSLGLWGPKLGGLEGQCLEVQRSCFGCLNTKQKPIIDDFFMGSKVYTLNVKLNPKP